MTMWYVSLALVAAIALVFLIEFIQNRRARNGRHERRQPPHFSVRWMGKPKPGRVRKDDTFEEDWS